MNPDNFRCAVGNLRRIYRGEISASLSTVEFYEPEASYISELWRKEHPSPVDLLYKRIYGDD
jgi:hypothetical protein